MPYESKAFFVSVKGGENMSMARIKEKIKKLPKTPGVYIMKDETGKVIYVGKSKALKNRVSQYFVNLKSHSEKTRQMVSRVSDFDYILTDTEAEALGLECNLIKKYRPKYNILLKDDKQYPYIKITKEDYPRILLTRKLIKDGGRYFGPYMSAISVRDTITTLRNIFMLRNCKEGFRKNKRTCLYFHIKQCSGPCEGKISKEEYNKNVEELVSVLKGNTGEIIKNLEAKMYEASEKYEYEKAAKLRDKIRDIKVLGERQKAIVTDGENRDIFGFYRENETVAIQVFYMRNGKIIGREFEVFEDVFNEDNETLGNFIKQFYYASTNIPPEILIPFEIEDRDVIESWLKEKNGRKTEVKIPQRGIKKDLVKMAETNAKEAYKQYLFKRNKEKLDANQILKELKETLGLEKIPARIESYDVSNISGKNSIGAEIVYVDGKMSKKDYRKFNIKTVEGADDYKSINEVIYRRLTESYKEQDAIADGTLQKEDAKFLPLPDLILLDGGKGHVNSVKTVLESLGEEIPLFGLVKDDKHRTRGITDGENELKISQEIMNFVTCIQDEVHRFAISSFRKKHGDEMTKSELENIKGVGPETRKKLLETVVSVDKIKTATFEELKSVAGEKVAKEIINYYRNNVPS